MGRFCKRGLDILISGMGLLTLSPLLLGLAILIRWRLGAPVLFRQTRPGWRGKLFTVIKFRSMREATDAEGNPLPDAQRLTGLGKFLRAASLDELPQLWNVLKGDLSLVGPRPLLVEYLPLYNSEQARRHEVKPGITGWAQINGRNAISWEERFALDMWYVEHWTFWLDLRILLLTGLRVIQRKGISQTGQVTMEKFHGTNLPAKNSSQQE